MKRMLAIVLVWVLALSLTSCRKVDGNQLDFTMLPADFDLTNGVAEVSRNQTVIHIDYSNKTFHTEHKENSPHQNDGAVITGGNGGRYEWQTKSEYEKLEKEISDLATRDKTPLPVYTQGYLIGDKVYGICNLYNKTAGYLFGAGHLIAEEIDHLIYYRYDKKTDNFEVLKKIDGAMAVAFAEDTVIYWKNKNLYRYNITDDTETFLCEDLSYDDGIPYHSYGTVYFNSHYVIFYFNKVTTNSETATVIVYDYENDSVTALTPVSADE